MTQSYYKQNEKTMDRYFDNHPAVVNPPDAKGPQQPKMNSKQVRNLLDAKVSAQMILKCNDNIEDSQIQQLIKYVDNPTGFDSTKPDFRALVEVDLV